MNSSCRYRERVRGMLVTIDPLTEKIQIDPTKTQEIVACSLKAALYEDVDKIECTHPQASDKTCPVASRCAKFAKKARFN